MLVLSRRPGESVVIGNSVRVTVIEASAGAVRLGFAAPSEVSIYREELYLAIAESNRAAIAGDLVGDDPGQGQLPVRPARAG